MAWTPSALHRVQVRPAVASDLGFATSMVPLLVASTPVSWRRPRMLFAAYAQVIESVLVAARPDASLLIAERSDGLALGLALLVVTGDCFTHKRHRHVAQIVTADVGFDSSARCALLAGAEEWARSHGDHLLMLGDFCAGHPAVMVCR